MQNILEEIMQRKEEKHWQYLLVICPDFESFMLALAVTLEYRAHFNINHSVSVPE